MPKLLKTHVQQYTYKIKHLILSAQPFDAVLAKLYTQLRLQGKHTWIIQTYQLLSLYTDEKQAVFLYHPALLQAFLSMGETKQAQKVARILLKYYPEDPETKKLAHALKIRKETSLPNYTPLAALSRYAKQAVHAPKTVGHLPSTWEKKLACLTPEKLNELGYYSKQKQLARAPKLYRAILRYGFDELIGCYLFQLDRSVVGLSGALLEMLLAMHLQHALGLKYIQFGGQRKKVFDLNLHELLTVYSQKKLLPAQVLNLCRAARAQRNFIHPGKEFLEKNRLTPSGVQVCFLAVLETIDALLK